MIDRSLKYRRTGRSAELRLFRGEQTVLNTRSLQTAECRFRIGQSRQFDRAHISSGLTRETDISQVPAACLKAPRPESRLRCALPGRRQHGAKLKAVQIDRRAHSKMVAAEHVEAPVELILGNVERNVADRAIGAAGILFGAPFDRKHWRRLGSVASDFAMRQNNCARWA